MKMRPVRVVGKLMKCKSQGRSGCFWGHATCSDLVLKFRLAVASAHVMSRKAPLTRLPGVYKTTSNGQLQARPSSVFHP
jgi:hypothetical protein